MIEMLLVKVEKYLLKDPNIYFLDFRTANFGDSLQK